jgi:thiamine transport system substrate-binding protein
MKKHWLLLVCGLAVVLASCAPKPPAQPVELRVMTHDSFAISEELVAQFEGENNAHLVFIQGGDAGSMLNQAILTRQSPQADVLYGVDNTFLARALEADLFEVYRSPLLAEIPQEYWLDADLRALPVDYGDVCINYDVRYFAEKGLALPQKLADLAKPEYRGLLVVENPATSSPGLAFLALTVANFSDERYLDFWQDLVRNDVLVANDWETAYYTHFSGSSGQGPRPMVVSYASSPAAEVMFASQPLQAAPTASLVGPKMCFRQVEFVGILKGTQQRDLAEKFVDFMLGPAFQADMPEQMFVYPVRQMTGLPDAFVQYAQVPEEPVIADAVWLAQNRERWIDEWTRTVLR